MSRPAGVLLSWFRRERSAHGSVAESPSPAAVTHALTNLGPDELAVALVEFLSPVLAPFPYEPLIRRHVRWLRHGLNHVSHAADLLVFRVERCAAPGGTYFQPGFGVMFWGNLARIAEPDLMTWTPSRAKGWAALDVCEAGRRSPVELWADANNWARAVRREWPEFSPTELGHFLDLVADMGGRELFPDAKSPVSEPWADALREVRSHTPLRQRIKRADSQRRSPESVVEEWTARREFPPNIAALTLERLRDDPLGPIDADLASAWEAVAGTELASEFVTLAQTVDGHRYPKLTGDARAMLGEIAGGSLNSGCPLDDYRTAWLMASGLAERWRAHIDEAAEVLTARRREKTVGVAEGEFPGLSGDGFRLLAELHTQPAAWFASQRDRYRYALQEPMTALGNELVDRFLRPVVGEGLGIELDLEVRPGRALSRTGHNYFGRGDGYAPEISLTFQPRAVSRHTTVQFFVRVDIDGLTWGVEWGTRSRGAIRRFRQRLQEHGDLLAMLLVPRLDGGEMATADAGVPRPIRREADLRAWAAEPMRAVQRLSMPHEGLWRREEWAGEIILTWGRLLPLFLFAAADDPVAALEKAYPRASTGRDLRHKFAERTHLPAGWLDRAVELLKVRRQLILRGVPGTGKTHVARELADYLAGGDAAAVRLVQFHPNFGYEDFVEGIRARAVEGADGEVGNSLPRRGRRPHGLRRRGEAPARSPARVSRGRDQPRQPAQNFRRTVIPARIPRAEFDAAVFAPLVPVAR